ncbi:MAG: hypothetical protein FJ151_02090 [Euryarchaeota archaeon]|nr:hypothetical protein [Euryarchaeota archaeon]
MPGGDGTGPWGLGPMTGRGIGFCAGFPMPGYARWRSPGLGRGIVYGWRRGPGLGRGVRRLRLLRAPFVQPLIPAGPGGRRLGRRQG